MNPSDAMILVPLGNAYGVGRVGGAAHVDECIIDTYDGLHVVGPVLSGVLLMGPRTLERIPHFVPLGPRTRIR